MVSAVGTTLAKAGKMSLISFLDLEEALLEVELRRVMDQAALES